MLNTVLLRAGAGGQVKLQARTSERKRCDFDIEVCGKDDDREDLRDLSWDLRPRVSVAAPTGALVLWHFGAY